MTDKQLSLIIEGIANELGAHVDNLRLDMAGSNMPREGRMQYIGDPDKMPMMYSASHAAKHPEMWETVYDGDFTALDPLCEMANRLRDNAAMLREKSE